MSEPTTREEFSAELRRLNVDVYRKDDGRFVALFRPSGSRVLLEAEDFEAAKVEAYHYAKP